jgi:hypothetical protein
MEHIKIKIGKEPVDLSGLVGLNFKPLFEYWNGAMLFIPKSIQLIDDTNYQNKKCLTWYERQESKNKKMMNKFKKQFTWLKN